ncbi:MAG: hypothetical protein WA830_15500, partial [Candidatus Sulfotelmatobacter sp.]
RPRVRLRRSQASCVALSSKAVFSPKEVLVSEKRFFHSEYSGSAGEDSPVICSNTGLELTETKGFSAGAPGSL